MSRFVVGLATTNESSMEKEHLGRKKQIGVCGWCWRDFDEVVAWNRKDSMNGRTEVTMQGRSQTPQYNQKVIFTWIHWWSIVRWWVWNGHRTVETGKTETACERTMRFEPTCAGVRSYRLNPWDSDLITPRKNAINCQNCPEWWMVYWYYTVTTKTACYSLTPHTALQRAVAALRHMRNYKWASGSRLSWHSSGLR